MVAFISPIPFMSPKSNLYCTDQSVVHDLLRFGHDALQMLFVTKTLRVNLVDVFRAGWTGREPAAGRDDLQPADGSAVTWSPGQFGQDRFSRQFRFLNRFGRK